MKPLVIQTDVYNTVELRPEVELLQIHLTDRIRLEQDRYESLTWEQAQQLHLWLKDWCFQNRPNQQCPYPGLHHPSCTCNGEGGAR